MGLEQVIEDYGMSETPRDRVEVALHEDDMKRLQEGVVD